MNKAELIGNITQDIEMKQTPSGQNVVSTSMATNENYKDKEGNKQQKTEFHNLVAWGKTAELLNNYVGKGSKLYVEGKLQTRNWEKDGVKHYRTEIVVSHIEFLSKKPEGHTPAGQVQSNEDFAREVKAENGIQKQQAKQDQINVEDIPF